jgi:hypothetical protein
LPGPPSPPRAPTKGTSDTSCPTKDGHVGQALAKAKRYTSDPENVFENKKRKAIIAGTRRMASERVVILVLAKWMASNAERKFTCAPECHA